MPAIELVMLDCDGVLIDSEFIAATVEAERWTAWGYPIDVETFGERFAGLGEEQIAARIAEETGRPVADEFVTELRGEITRRIVAEVEPIEGAGGMVAALAYPLCVCSNSSVDQLRQSLGRVGMWDTFDGHVFSARDLGPGRMKPAPDVFLHAAEAMGADPSRAVVVEDSVHGVSGAVAAGARAIGFTGGRHTWRGHADALTEAGASTVVSRHADIPATVDALARWDERAA